jgi:hypothetical protein
MLGASIGNKIQKNRNSITISEKSILNAIFYAKQPLEK